MMAGLQPYPAADAPANARIALQALLPLTGHRSTWIRFSALYAARAMKPMWDNREAVQAFQQQLAEVAIAGFQPHHTWVELLTDPNVSVWREMWCCRTP
jgi:murein L,D-transpeptidase YcbB/YkuD